MGGSYRNLPILGKMGCHFLLQKSFPTQGPNPHLLRLLHWQTDSLPLAPPGKPWVMLVVVHLVSASNSFITPWSVAHQAPLSLGLSRQVYWSGLPFPSLGNLHNPGMEHTSSGSPELAGQFFTTVATWEALELSLNRPYSFSRGVEKTRD